MIGNRTLLIALVLGIFTILQPVQAQQSSGGGNEEVTIKIDPVTLIKKSTVKYQGKFKVNERSAVSQMDTMLTEQYGSRGRISNEKNANLKSLYYQAATLLLNGYPIAGGTLVSVARNEPGFAQSPAGGGLVSFVDAMLQPSDEDADLLAMQERVKKARALSKDLRSDLRFYADLWVVGSIYLDDIAVDAGKAGVEAMKASANEKKKIQQALGAK